MSDATTEAPKALTDLSGDDVFRLQTATFFSLAQALNQAGVIRLGDLAGQLETHLADEDDAPWSHVLRAFVTVLRRGGPTPVEPDESVEEARRFAVIDGGRV